MEGLAVQSARRQLRARYRGRARRVHRRPSGPAVPVADTAHRPRDPTDRHLAPGGRGNRQATRHGTREGPCPRRGRRCAQRPRGHRARWLHRRTTRRRAGAGDGARGSCARHPRSTAHCEPDDQVPAARLRRRRLPRGRARRDHYSSRQARSSLLGCQPRCDHRRQRWQHARGGHLPLCAQTVQLRPRNEATQVGGSWPATHRD
mmetsp:Transcript_48004/g.102546  ORF Transcript_48004/g.102546 Transcript_48004/m.102546 type:complete len:204 (-) Transcript_48004:531-1142(-)